MPASCGGDAASGPARGASSSRSCATSPSGSASPTGSCCSRPCWRKPPPRPTPARPRPHCHDTASQPPNHRWAPSGAKRECASPGLPAPLGRCGVARSPRLAFPTAPAPLERPHSDEHKRSVVPPYTGQNAQNQNCCYPNLPWNDSGCESPLLQHQPCNKQNCTHAE